ncbi:YheC/YheD family protein [Paenibacillus hamazuiensis]|uniref:YheC/YheD family endospore coat-associated protein n=1 Tax=Paenibacillus hamazuiensis TaxID=2936508 RepID=UPI00200F248E|nr:YheC/YheD family protein [Paenibacillus hamazuiensis]
MLKPVIGILAYRKGAFFENAKFLRDLIREGKKLGADVYAFSHVDLLEKSRKIRGYVPDERGKWTKRISSWPDIVIDFCRMLRKPYRDMRRRKDLFPYANNKFTYKWKAMLLFSESEQVKKWIPETGVYSSSRLSEMLEKYPIVYVKPGNGTGGHSIAKIKKAVGGYVLQGRKRSGKKIMETLKSEASVLRRIRRWVRAEQIRSGNFMVQQGLDLELLPGRMIDTRLIVQKNGKGAWVVTGKALRVGAKNSPTTNLIYGDGKALRFDSFMKERFGAEKAEQISRECDELALRLMEVIEGKFGSMIEFGLDIGIDTKGNVWFIEANPKPSHEAFIKSGELAAYRKSIRRPIQYAMFLAGRLKGR